MGSDRIKLLKETLPAIQTLTELKKKTANESAGPCPLCGGVDRFVMFHDSDKWFCRQCHEKPGDVIDLHCLIDELDLKGLMDKYLGPNGDNKRANQPKGMPFNHYQFGIPTEKYAYIRSVFFFIHIF